MKLKLEFGQYEIEIEEKDGSVVVKAEKDDEIVEEFTLSLEEGSESEEFEGEEGEELMPFDSQEEEDFEGEEDEEDMEEMEDDMEEMEGQEDEEDEEESTGGEMKLESFQSFISKRK